MDNKEVEALQDIAYEEGDKLFGGQAHAQYLIAVLLAELILRLKKGDV